MVQAARIGLRPYGLAVRRRRWLRQRGPEPPQATPTQAPLSLLAVVQMAIVYALAQLVHVAAVLAHGALGDAALFLPVAVLEVLRERFRRFRGAVGGSLARYIRLLAEFLQVILMRGVLASGEIEHLVHGALALALALQREGDVFPSRLFAGVPTRLRRHARRGCRRA